MNGEGHLSYEIRNGKIYYTGKISAGTDINGRRIRKTFGGYKKSEVLEKVQNALAEINNNNFILKKDITFGDFFMIGFLIIKNTKLNIEHLINTNLFIAYTSALTL